MLQNIKSVLQKTKKTNSIELVFIVNCTLFVTLYRTDTATDNHPDQSQSSRKRCPDPEDGGSVCVPSHWHLNHTLGNRWVVNRVNILRLLVQVFIKVHSHGLLAIDSHVVNQATLIQEVES